MKYGKEFFISGIDTDCGKTFITGLLAFHLHHNNIPTITTKLVQTGCEGISEDIVVHRGIMEIGLFDEDKTKLTCPNIFSYPASPHLAAKLDKQDLNLDLFRNNTEALLDEYRIVLSEGAGGLMVPLETDYLSIEYIKEHNLPLILVSSSKLGSINHTLMSINICKNYNINLISVIYNHLPESDETISIESFKILERYLPQYYKDCRLINGKVLEKTNKKAIDQLDFLLQ